MGYQFDTDCEGPISKNDNAMELSEFYIPGGRHFFSIVSKYDDYLADIEKRPGYKAGDTLKLILPFLKAFGATDEGMKEFSREHILLVPGAKEALHAVGKMMEAFIISTSYKPYIDALCDVVGFPKDRTYSTELSLNKYVLKGREKKRLASLVEEVQEMEMIDWPEGAQGLEDISDRDRRKIQKLNEIFWEEIKEMAIGRIFSDINPMGGKEKANAVLLSLEKTRNRLDEALYIGDSITDVDAFDLVRRGGGITVSFNGNRYAVRSAEVACLSSDASALTILADAFQKGGREGVIEMVDRWKPDSGYPKVCRITDENRTRLIQESEMFRKQVRGVAIGSLG
jgi:energy-converting hydrogenase A subunit R